MKSNGNLTVVELEKGWSPPLETKRHYCGDKIGNYVTRWKAYILKFCSKSGLHGLSYVGDVRRPLVERFLWLLLFCASFTVCTFLIRSVWIKWKTTPVIVTFAETPTPVWEIPFPAVTICSQNKIGKQIFFITRSQAIGTNVNFKIPPRIPVRVPEPSGISPNEQGNDYEEPNAQYDYNIERESATQSSTGEENIIHERRKRFYDMSQWCNEDAFDGAKNFTDDRIVYRLKEEAPTLKDTIGLVKWKNHEVDVTKHFRPILTQNGLCFTFNMFDDDEIYKEEVVDVMKRNNDQLRRQRRVPQWSPDGGYKAGSGFDTYPARTPGSGLYSELYIILKSDVYATNFKCKGPVHGFKVQVHSPAEVPALSKQYFRVPLGEDVAVAVKPNTMTTADELRGYSPQHRQCYFSDERYLRFFREYTQRNCEMECHANETLRSCDCVPFYMPRAEDTPICNLGRKNCLKQLGEERVEKVVRKYEERVSTGGRLDATGCDCLPSCSVLDYETEIFQADIDGESYRTEMERLRATDFEYKLTGISLYFKDTQFFGRRRSELYGITDFIANCGGLLGLFMGFSILSLIEVIYFFTLRVGLSVTSKRNQSTQTTKEHHVDTTHL